MFDKLTEDQRNIAIKIADEARAAGVDPELALAVGWAENRFNASGRSPKGAVGPMQVMPANARGLGIDPKDLLDPDKNIKAGIAILKENLTRFNDPTAALVGYNANPRLAGRFLESGDKSLLPEETRLYLEKVGQLTNLTPGSRYGELTPVPEEVVREDIQELPEAYQMARRALFGEGEIEPAKTAGIGALGGTLVGAGERLYDVFGKRAATGVTDKVGLSGGPSEPGAWGRKTGYGIGEGSTREQSERYQRAAGHGKVSKEVSKRYGAGTPLDIERQAAQTAEKEAAEKFERELAERAAKERATKEAMAKTSKFLGRIPFGSVIAGGVAGHDLAEAMQRYEEGDVSGALINAVGGLGSAAALIPHPATRIIGGALGLASMPAEYINDVLKGKIKPTKAEPADYVAP